MPRTTQIVDLVEATDSAYVLEPRAQLDKALLGVTQSPRYETPRAVYSRDLVLRALCEGEDPMDMEEAIEWYEFNIAGAYIDGGPVFLGHPGTCADAEEGPYAGETPGHALAELKDYLETVANDDDELPLLGNDTMFDDALLGISEGLCKRGEHLFYCKTKCLEILESKLSLSRSEAIQKLDELLAQAVGATGPALVVSA